MKTNFRHTNKHVLHGAMMGFMGAHRKVIRDEFHKVNLTQGKPKILDFLLVNSGCSQKDVSRNCHIEPATVTSILSSMEEEGLISRDRNSKDKRIINVSITEKGKEAQSQVEKTFSRIDDWSFEGFTEEERSQALAFINRMRENLEQKLQSHDDGC